MVKFEMVDGGDSMETNFKCWAIGATVEHLRFCQVRTFGVRAFAQDGEIRSARMNSGSQHIQFLAALEVCWVQWNQHSADYLCLHRFFRPSHDRNRGSDRHRTA